MPDQEATARPPDALPLESSPGDWQEQLETVELDPDFEELDRD